MPHETEVRDRPAELWIKVLSLVAVVTLPLISGIGYFLIHGQEETNNALERTNEALQRMSDKMNQYNAQLQTNASRISRNEEDIKNVNKDVKELRVISSSNTFIIDKLKGVNEYGQ